MRHLFVFNPHSFRTREGLNNAISDAQRTFFVDLKRRVDTYVSRRQRDAVAAVRRYMLATPPDETARIYAVGGDGILFDCLNGMISFPNAELTSVPYGAANDYVRAFGEDAIPIFRDIKKLALATSRPVDVIDCGSNFALIELNIGIVGETVFVANAFLRNNCPKWIHRFTSHVYSISAFRALTNTDILRQHYSITVDGVDYSGSYTNIHVANIPCDGGSFIPSPYAVPDDGVLDAIFMTSASQMQVIRNIGLRNKGKFEKSPLFSYVKCKTLEIDSDAPISITLDGEAFYTQSLRVRIVPNGVKFVVPDGLDFADYSNRAFTHRS